MFKLSNIVRKSYFLNYSFNTASQIDVYRVNTLTFLTLQTDSNDSFLSKNNKKGILNDTRKRLIID